MSLALCSQAVSHASQHFGPSKKQATCEGCFARQSICSVISLHAGMSTGVFEGGCRPSTHSCLGFPFHFSIFCSKFTESVRMMASVVRLSLLEAIQRRAWMTASTSIFKLEVETVQALLSSWMRERQRQRQR